MSGNPENNGAEATKKEILFKCKFCGQEKPLSDLVVLRHYFPQLSACRECAKGKRVNKDTESEVTKED